MIYKGEIPWTDEHPISCIHLNFNTFDVLASSSGRKYHLTSQDDAGSSMWISLINAALGK